MNRNHQLRVFTTVIFMLMIVVSFPTWNWAKQSVQAMPEELWFNIPSSPLEVRFSPSKRDSLLFNRSSGQVVRYRLGCVIGGEGSKLKVVRKTPFVDTDLESGKVLINSISMHATDIARCVKSKTRLAVIEVVFKDGFVWKAN